MTGLFIMNVCALARVILLSKYSPLLAREAVDKIVLRQVLFLSFYFSSRGRIKIRKKMAGDRAALKSTDQKLRLLLKN